MCPSCLMPPRLANPLVTSTDVAGVSNRNPAWTTASYDALSICHLQPQIESLGIEPHISRGAGIAFNRAEDPTCVCLS
jgi:hypothetical protein